MHHLFYTIVKLNSLINHIQMNHSPTTPEIKEVIKANHYRPAISIILPFEPKMSLKTELTHALKIASDTVEKKLTKEYPEEISVLVMRKLRNIINGLNYNTHKKSIAIYVSPVFDKVLYLDIAVEKKIFIDESFEIRDLVYSKKQINKYLVLMISHKECRIFLGNTTDFVRIMTNTPEDSIAYQIDAPEKIANFSDASAMQEVQLKKFLLQVDNSLKIILNAYKLPLFIMGTEKVIGTFKKITKHTGSIIDFIHGNYEKVSLSELLELLKPYKENWKKVIETNIVNKLIEAEGNTKLVSGIRDVWRTASNQKGQLLVLEKNYMYPAENNAASEVIYKAIEPFNKFSYIKDAVDDVIEKVLENGGDVEFVEEGMLAKYNHIALIQYY